MTTLQTPSYRTIRLAATTAAYAAVPFISLNVPYFGIDFRMTTPFRILTPLPTHGYPFRAAPDTADRTYSTNGHFAAFCDAFNWVREYYYAFHTR